MTFPRGDIRILNKRKKSIKCRKLDRVVVFWEECIRAKELGNWAETSVTTENLHRKKTAKGNVGFQVPKCFT